jgi:DNA polymerase elongation subunit (family B)
VVGLLQYASMDNLHQLELIDKVQRELKDLEQSQTAVLKKISQIAAHNLTLNVPLLNQKLPDLEDKIGKNVAAVKDLCEAFDAFRDKYFVDNKMAAHLDPTA